MRLLSPSGVGRPVCLALLIVAEAEPVAAQAPHRVRPDTSSETHAERASRSKEADDATRLVLTMGNRQFLIPERVVAGLKIQPAIGARLRVSPSLTLLADAQTVDNSGPGRQGPFLAIRALGDSAGSGNFLQELTLGARLTSGRSAGPRGALRLDVSLSHARRSYSLVDTTNGTVVEHGNRSEVVPSAVLGWIRSRDRLSTSVGVGWAGFPAGNAMYLRRLPSDSSRRFGSTTGPSLGLDLGMSSAVAIVGRVFVPLTGNNSIERSNGHPARTPTFDAGVTWRLNPSVVARLFASNALGPAGALALVADREYVALGAGLDVHMGRGANQDDDDSGSPPADRGAFGTSTVAALLSDAIAVRLYGGSAGAGGWARVHAAQGLNFALFSDGVTGAADESEIGGVMQLTLVDHRPKDGRGRSGGRLAVLAAASHTNNVFINFLQGDSRALHRLGLPKRPIRFGRENDASGELYLITLGAVLSRDFDGGQRVWMTPLTTLAQRRGRQLDGVLLGGTAPFARRGWFGSELGLPFGRGENVLGDSSRTSSLAWASSLGWRLSSLLRLDATVGNRIGVSPFHALRVRAGHAVGATVGLSLSR